jgi:hypothetical protein
MRKRNRVAGRRDRCSESRDLTANGVDQLAHAQGFFATRANRGKRGELLTQIYWWFIEGFDTRDLKEANALLEELAS